MLIGVVSDTHNNLKNIEKIISLFNERNVSFVIHTGDIANAKSLDKFSKLHCDLIGVYGNNDRNEIGLAEIAKKNKFDIDEPPKIININNRIVAIFHEPDCIESFLINNQSIEVVFHGHTHRYREEFLNNTLIYNPGESAGIQSGNNAIGIIDLDNLSTERIFF